MQVKVLGSAAGGGFPQWNCACSNCAGVRSATLKAKPRCQVQIAIGIDGTFPVLLNASPDLRFQIESEPGLQPRGSLPASRRDSPIHAVILTSADVDQVLGLLLMREFQPFTVYSSTSVRRILMEDNSMMRTLCRVSPQVGWRDFTPEPFPLLGDRLQCRVVPLGSHFPEYVSAMRQQELSSNDALAGLVIEDAATHRRFCFFPSLPAISPEIRSIMDSCDCVMLDGTFWSDDELVQVRGSGRTATQMGHMPISGSNGSLAALRTLRAKKKMYIHINNTNPILDDDGPQRAEINAAGWIVAEDGMEFDL